MTTETLKAQHGLPSGAYAIVGDAADPNTWKLPLWRDATGEISPGRLSAALGHLGKMDDVAKARVAHAYRHLHPTRRLPDALAAAAGELVKAAGTLEPMIVPVEYRVAKDLSPAAARTDLMDAVGEMPPSPDQTVGCMIGFGLPTDVTDVLAVAASDGVVPQDAADMHVTLAYVPLPAGMRGQALELAAAAMRAAATARPFEVEISGYAIFLPDDDGANPLASDDDGDGEAPATQGTDDGDADSDGPWYTAVALVDSPDVAELRADLIDRLNDCGLPVDDRTHGFVPHVTLATATDETKLLALPLPEPLTWVVDSMCVAIGGVVQHFPLIAGWGENDEERYGVTVAMQAQVKSDDAKRYTLAPLYVPGRHDTHKEWMHSDALEESQWNYVRGGDRTITLQHMPDVPAGEMVGCITWPYPVRCDLMTGDGVAKSVELPAGTVYMGVIWEPWAYERAKSCLMNGLSLEGFAQMADGSAPA